MRRVWCAVAIFCALFFAVQAYRWSIWTFGADTGTFSQVVLDAFRGFRDGPEQGTHFRFHWAPALAVLYPIMALARSGLAMQYAQVTLIACCTFPLYALARRYASERIALAAAILPLVYPPLVAVAFGEFHEIAFYPVVALALVWAADAERWWTFSALAVASCIIREECCIVFVVLGVAWALLGTVRSRWRGMGSGLLLLDPRSPRAVALAGATLAILNAAALAVYFLVVIPRVGAWQPVHFYDYPFGYGPIAVTLALLAHPALAPRVFTMAKLTYLLEALAPVGFLPLRSAWSAIALPGFVALLLSSDWVAFRMGSHYAAIWIPWLLLGTAAAGVALERRGARVALHRVVTAVAALCALFFVAFDPLHPLHFLRPIYPHAAVWPLLQRVPHDAPLITHDEWFAHIAAQYPRATIFPYTPYAYALFADDYPNAYYRDVVRARLLALAHAGDAVVVARQGAVALWRVRRWR